MAIRQTTLVIKNNTVPNAPFSGATLLKGEPIVNTADGIMMFSGVTSSTSEWTPAGTGGNSTFFEVGSNLYDLRLRNRLTQYEGTSGSGLVGQFLSGTTNGFVLAPISAVTSLDTFVTGFTYTAATNTLYIYQNQGKTPLPVTISEMSGLTINGDLTVTGTTNLSGLTLYDETVSGTNPLEIINYGYLTSFTQTNDVYVTGATYSPANNNSDSTTWTLQYHGTPLNPPHTFSGENTYTTGGTYNSGTTSIDFNRNDGVTYSVDLSSIDINDTFVTGFTYSPSTNTFTIYQNQGESPLPATISEVSGLTVNGNLSVTGLGTNRVVYTTGSGQLTTESDFTYDQGTDILGVTNIEASGDVTIQGSLTVFGPSISAFTTNLYVEDPNIYLNYNPTGSTTVTSVNAGFTIQDGNGVSSGDVNFDIIRLQNLTGLTSNNVPNVSEYTSSTGYSNRGWITQLNDIVIRSTDVTDEITPPSSINGVRVLAEFDVLDGGQY